MPKKAITCIFALMLLSSSPSFPLSHAEELRTPAPKETAVPVVTGDGNSPREKIPKDTSTGHDIQVRELGLTDDLELYVVVSNSGEVDLPKDSTLRVRIFVNDRKFSDFEHLTARVLKGKAGNRYTVHPPYPVAVGGVSLVKASVWSTLPSRDIDPRNNSLVRNFIIYPFRIEPKAKQEFSFSIFSRRTKNADSNEKVIAEARWDGDGFPLRLSFKGSVRIKGDTTISGKSPLKMEVPLFFEETDKREDCRVSVTNPLRQKVVGHVIIQHP